MKSPAKRSPPKKPSFSYEAPELGIVCGVDEAGRGPLAGPVYAGCVYVPVEKRQHPVWKDVRDSKQLTAGRRDDLFNIIQTQSMFGIGVASVEEIDEINILQATYLAMARAIEAMVKNFSIPQIDLVLIDGNRAPKISYKAETLVKGDALSISIGAASILAKVSRDRFMNDLHLQHTHYCWNSNAGYGTPEHLDAISKHGITPHHRKTFAPIKDIIFKQAS
jgi:ribonuclease HII